MSRPPRLPGIDDSAKRVLILLGANRNGLTIEELDTYLYVIAELYDRGFIERSDPDCRRQQEEISDHVDSVIRRVKWRPTQKAIDMVEAYERCTWTEFAAMSDEYEEDPLWDYWLGKKGMSGALRQVEDVPRVKGNERLQQAIALYRTAETAIDALMREIGV